MAISAATRSNSARNRYPAALAVNTDELLQGAKLDLQDQLEFANSPLQSLTRRPEETQALMTPLLEQLMQQMTQQQNQLELLRDGRG